MGSPFQRKKKTTKKAAQIMSILCEKYITYGKLIQPKDAVHEQKFH